MNTSMSKCNKVWTMGCESLCYQHCLNTNRGNQQLFSAYNPQPHCQKFTLLHTDSDSDKVHVLHTFLLQATMNSIWSHKWHIMTLLISPPGYLLIFCLWTEVFVKGNHFVNWCVIKIGKIIHPLKTEALEIRSHSTDSLPLAPLC